MKFLRNVSYIYDLGNDGDGMNVVLCRPLPESQCDVSSDGECTEEGTLRCFEIPQFNETNDVDILRQYVDRRVEIVKLKLGDGRSVGMYVIPNDTVSNHLLESGTFAPILTALVDSITRTGCRSEDRPNFVLDLGCNLGLVSLIALAHGCDVLCVEPIDMLIPTLLRSILSNRFNATAAVLHAAAGDTWHEVTVVSCGAACENPAAGDGGGLALAWGEVRRAAPGGGRTMSVPLGEYLRGRALLVKVDVEGYEWAAAQGLNRWLADYGFDHLLVEAKHRPAATLAALLQGCGEDRRPRIRGWKERYYGRVEEWEPARLPLVEIGLAELMAPRGGQGAMPVEDFWVVCEAVGQGVPEEGVA